MRERRAALLRLPMRRPCAPSAGGARAPLSSQEPGGGRVERLVRAAERLGALRRLGPIHLHERFAVGGMAGVHFGWLVATNRLVAVKRLHRHLLVDEVFTKMLLDEARLAMQVCHPNVVSILGVSTDDRELLVAMDYVHGASVAELLAAVQPRAIAPAHAVAIVVHTLNGLDAAHAACGGDGRRLGIVHRDVSPQNLLLGADGVPRVVDFGIAKAAERLQTTMQAIVKGKLAYTSPEQLTEHRADARSDVYGAATVLWEVLTGRPLFHAATVQQVLRKILCEPVPPPSFFAPGISPELDAIVLRGLARDANARFASARAMAEALTRAVPMTSTRDLAWWLSSLEVAPALAREQQAAVVYAREAGA